MAINSYPPIKAGDVIAMDGPPIYADAPAEHLVPTGRLRWVPASKDTQTRIRSGPHWTGDEFLVLQQWWQQVGATGGEWRDIPVEAP